MYFFNLLVIIILIPSILGKSIEPNCSATSFFKILGCIGELADFFSTVANYNLTEEAGRQNFTASCDVTAKCFDETGCVHSDKQKKFIQTFCSYAVFVETDFKDCNTKLTAKNGTDCEKTFKSSLYNDLDEEVKCKHLENSLSCIRNEVTEVCGKNDAIKMEGYLVDMSASIVCKNPTQPTTKKSEKV